MKWKIKKPRIIVVAVSVMFILLVTSYVAGFFAYEGFQKKIEYFDEKMVYLDGYNEFLGNKFVNLEKNLDKVKFDLDVAANTSSMRRREILGKIESIKKDIEDWQAEYKLGLAEIKEEFINKVDLGKISVKQNDKGSDNKE